MNSVIILFLSILIFPTFAGQNVRKCSPQKSHPYSKILLKDLSWIKFNKMGPLNIDDTKIIELSKKHRSDDVTYVGHNTYLINCSNIDKDTFLGKLSASFQAGLSCLSKLGRYRFKDASRLLTLLDSQLAKPHVIRCESNSGIEYMGIDSRYKNNENQIGGDASAFVCTNNLYPGAIFSSYSIKRILSAQSIADTSVLFHEFSHLLGYIHDESHSIDVVRQTEACCFPGAIDINLNPHLQLENACEKLRGFKKNI